MPIRPIDMQVMMPKIQKINENQKGVENRQINAAADQQSENMKKTEIRKKKVDRKDTKDNAKVKAKKSDDNGKKGGKGKERKKNLSDNKETTKGKKDSFSTSKFDIKI